AQPAPTDFFWDNLDMNIINEGVELTVDANIVDTDAFFWEVSANASYNDNRIENYEGLVNTGAISGQGLTGAFAQRIATGQPLYSYFLRPFGGFDEAGQSIYPEGDVQQFVGRSPLPLYNIGFTNNFNYGQFDLSVFFNGQLGQYVYNNTANAFFTAGALAGGNNVTADVVGNGESRVNAPEVSTRFLEDASFLRLQNFTLGYNINTENISFLSNARIFFTGQNVLTFTNYSGQDPEVNVNKAINDVPSFGIDYTPYPRARTFLLGVNVTF
ncbi:MAG: SusC/RagA family TonB-linked outer membrane protein, partial [Cyclobacteriaceae bacterium]